MYALSKYGCFRPLITLLVKSGFGRGGVYRGLNCPPQNLPTLINVYIVMKFWLNFIGMLPWALFYYLRALEATLT